MESPASAVELTLVVPLYNEEETFDRLVARLIETMDSFHLASEVVLVDDGSTDATASKIRIVCAADERFRGLVLSRNFGQQAAISAGLDHARGQYVGVLDADLQDPPELLPALYKKLREGYDVAYAVRGSRREGPLKRLCYWGFYRLLRSVARLQIPLDSGDFCMMRRRVVEEIRRMPERHRFLRGMRSWVGFRQAGIPYDRDERHAGRSKYTFGKLVTLAVDGLVTFSETPLRLATLAGGIVSLAAFVWAIYIFIWRLVSGPGNVPGFATLACGMFFLGGVQLVSIGILGEYIARIHNEVKGRPLYIVESVVERSNGSADGGLRVEG